MTIDTILSAIDEEILKLQQVRAMLSGIDQMPGKRGVGRSKGSKAKVTEVKRRAMSEEARAKIAAAQKKRWAVTKKVK